MNSSGFLLDTGPLVALLAKADQNHEEAKALFSKFQPPFRTCEAVLTEACFLLGRFFPQGPESIITLGKDKLFEIGIHLEEDWSSLQALLNKYRDHPISLADACLIRCAEIHNEPRILTFDSDFEFYRWGRNKKFEVLKS